MAKLSRPRFGSLQIWPRKRAAKALPGVNWKAIAPHAENKGLMGFIAYKAGMATAIVRDKTDKSMTVNKKIALPVTIFEVPKLRIYSVRFYKNKQIIREIVVSNEKELKRIVRVPKQTGEFKEAEGWDEVRVLAYTVMKGMFRKAPQMTEIAIKHEKPVDFVKEHLTKEIALKELIHGGLVDVHGVTRGKGLVGPVKRFGISLKSHKSEKGVRRAGSLGPWHPARVTFRVSMAGQMGNSTRVQYNSVILTSGSVAENAPISSKSSFPHYGTLTNDYLIVAGSVQGPPKRAVVLTATLRPTKKQLKKKYEFLELKI